ncbi:tryptophan--tRNA ligase, mitochondrial [Copidosoma floridanum]|uniref:tryptophan--tRNA ligase, mitochondrial n=1 Tax=Copidosoma floridanum TaxID=29053 RepID=UPI0006C9B5A2|nr:tryptophan--tRNA ligase, mitochondrial [Copidosoma floridanum]
MLKKVLTLGQLCSNQLKVFPSQYIIRTLRRLYCSKEAKSIYPKRIFSGIQPTGTVHLGNYLGAIKGWVNLQNAGEDVIYSIVDMHSITLTQKPLELKENIIKLTATLLACGIDPKKSILFQQSVIPMHAELSWIFSCLVTMPRLARQPQYKEKSETLKDVPLGLYIYPVLQTADILLYKATHVPVGEDQVQHIQLAEHLAQKFNSTFGKTFPMPISIVNRDAGRIKSLKDPEVKMSKSCTNVKSRIDLTDTPDDILIKVKKAITDFTSEVTFDPENRPGIANLINIHSMLIDKTPEEICQDAKGLDTGKYKLLLADIVIEKLNPIRKEIEAYLSEPEYLHQLLQEGARKAESIAVPNWLEVRNKVGFGIDTLSINLSSKRSQAIR